MKGAGIFGLAGFYQGEDQALVVKQRGEFLVTTLALQPKIFFQEFYCLWHVRDRKIDMIQFHIKNLQDYLF
jgi:hypothetical protein